MTRSLLHLIAMAALLASVPLAASAQSPSSPVWDPQGLQMERSELEALLLRQEEVASSSGYSGRVREQARRDAEQIRERLEHGDFRLGDRVLLQIEGEPDLPPEYPVESGPQIVLPVIGPISLEGVLRSELEEYLTEVLSRYYRNPRIQTEARVRVSILGAVNSPGFYHLAPTTLVSEALTAAGQPSQGANLEEVQIVRGGEVLWEGEEMAMVLAEGRTLDQLNLQAGDQIVVPAVQTGSFLNSNWGQVLRWGLALGTSILFGVRLFL